MTTARSISRVDSTVEMGIVNKVEMDGVVYRDPTGKCYLLDKVLSENKSSVILVFAFAFPSSLFSWSQFTIAIFTAIITCIRSCWQTMAKHWRKRKSTSLWRTWSSMARRRSSERWWRGLSVVSEKHAVVNSEEKDLRYFRHHLKPAFFLSNMKLKLHDLIYLACLYGQKGIVEDIIQHQQRRGEFEVSKHDQLLHSRVVVMLQPLLFLVCFYEQNL